MPRTKLNALFTTFLLFTVLLAGRSVQPARAQQFDPRLMLQGTIQQLQTGTPNPYWYSPVVWQTIAAQTASTGIYPILVQFGPVQDIVVTNQIPLPDGTVYAMTAQHLNGTTMWTLGLGSLSNRIEYLNFNWQANAAVVQNPPAQPSFGTPNALPQGGVRQGGEETANRAPANAPPVSGSSSEPCRKFPNLCP